MRIAFEARRYDHCRGAERPQLAGSPLRRGLAASGRASSPISLFAAGALLGAQGGWVEAGIPDVRILRARPLRLGAKPAEPTRFCAELADNGHDGTGDRVPLARAFLCHVRRGDARRRPERSCDDVQLGCFRRGSHGNARKETPLSPETTSPLVAKHTQTAGSYGSAASEAKEEWESSGIGAS